jgi:Tfp pilus assembly protein PilF
LKIRTFGIIILLFFGQLAFGQSKELAYAKAMEAIKLMDNGELSKSIVLLEEAIKLDPKNIVYFYELALAHTYNKDYNEPKNSRNQ